MTFVCLPWAIFFRHFRRNLPVAEAKESRAFFGKYTSLSPPDVHVAPAFRFQRAPNSANIEIRSSSEHSDKFRDSQPKSGEQGVDEICHSHSAEVPGGDFAAVSLAPGRSGPSQVPQPPPPPVHCPPDPRAVRFHRILDPSPLARTLPRPPATCPFLPRLPALSLSPRAVRPLLSDNRAPRASCSMQLARRHRHQSTSSWRTRW